jgi:hypothetical protein
MNDLVDRLHFDLHQESHTVVDLDIGLYIIPGPLLLFLPLLYHPH